MVFCCFFFVVVVVLFCFVFSFGIDGWKLAVLLSMGRTGAEMSIRIPVPSSSNCIPNGSQGTDTGDRAVRRPLNRSSERKLNWSRENRIGEEEKRDCESENGTW